MAKSLVWKDLSQFQIDSYCNLASREDCFSFLSEKFNLGLDEKSNILKDLYFYTLEFAKTNRFTPSQISAYFSIIKETHRTVSANPKIMLERDYAYFKNLVLIHSIQRPPYSEKIFKYKTMMLLLDYTTNTYFRHYLMYKYAFSKKMRLELVIENFASEEPSISEEQISSEASITKTNPAEKPQTEPMPTDTAPPASTPPEPAVSQTQSVKEETSSRVSNGAENTSKNETIVPVDLDTTVGTVQSSPLPHKSPKHEAAITELKTFISSVLSSKLDEIKSSVLLQGSEDSKKDASKSKPGKK